MTPYSSIWYSRHSGGIFFTYDSWPILMPEKNATSRDFRSRQIKRIDGLNRTGTGLRSNKPMAFLGTVPRSKKGLGTEASAARPTNGAVRGRAPEQQRRAQPTPPQIWSNVTGRKKEGMEEIGAPEERGRPPATLTVAIVDLARGRVGERRRKSTTPAAATSPARAPAAGTRAAAEEAWGHRNAGSGEAGPTY
jgi:hypothetical protein